MPLTLQRLQASVQIGLTVDSSGETKRATNTIRTIAQESYTKTRFRPAVEITVLQTRRGRGGGGGGGGGVKLSMCLTLQRGGI